jgi:hypothetical protein
LKLPGVEGTPAAGLRSTVTPAATVPLPIIAAVEPAGGRMVRVAGLVVMVGLFTVMVPVPV